MFDRQDNACWINGVKCQLGPDNGGRPVSKNGFKVGRLIKGEHCGCTVAWTYDNGHCPCAPKATDNPLSVVEVK
jgi:hypothetical protein